MSWKDASNEPNYKILLPIVVETFESKDNNADGNIPILKQEFNSFMLLFTDTPNYHLSFRAKWVPFHRFLLFCTQNCDILVQKLDFILTPNAYKQSYFHVRHHVSDFSDISFSELLRWWLAIIIEFLILNNKISNHTRVYIYLWYCLKEFGLKTSKLSNYSNISY